jgi:hypothetical protein
MSRFRRRYKREAIFVAAKRADALLEQGDHEGCSAWVSIGKAIDALLREKPREDEAVH